MFIKLFILMVALSVGLAGAALHPTASNAAENLIIATATTGGTVN